MFINNEIIENYFDCIYKSHLNLKGVQGDKCNLEKLLLAKTHSLKEEYIADALKMTNLNAVAVGNSLEELIKQRRDYIINADLQFEDFNFHCDFLKKIPSKSRFGNFAYMPVLLIPTENIPRRTKILIAGIAHALGKIQNTELPGAEIIYGRKFKINKIKTEVYFKEFRKAAAHLKEHDQFSFHLNAHCSVCEFSKTCREKAVAEGHLSLLKGITRERIKELNRKGIFSINQLSYTFRPKRKQPKKENRCVTRSVELQALAIREQKVFIYDTPAPLPNPVVEMFLDIEGVPDDNFYYLIGLTVKTNAEIGHNYYWANNTSEELIIAEQFLKYILTFDDFVIYHYGSYEITFLKKLTAKLPSIYEEPIARITRRCYNVLSVLYTHVYFPTYSNSLKEVGNFIGFNWSAPYSTGLESIFWRKSWEVTRDVSLKEKLLTYNQEDCTVLMYLKETIDSIIENKISALPGLQFGKVQDLQKEQKTTFIANESFFPELKFINECSYFDYQREKVYTKTDPVIRKARPLKTKKKKSIYDIKPHKTIDLKSQVCEQCKSEFIFTAKILSRRIVDLHFTKNGIKVSITQYNSGECACMSCKHRFIPAGYPIGRLKLGHSLIVWAIFQHVVNNQGFRKIESNFSELFHLYISSSTFFACKDYFIRYYESAYNELLHAVLTSDVLYVDETPFTMLFEKGYVWVFTNGAEVISIYKSNREAGFLKEFLKDFTGTLVTDFYNGYESLDFRQQKCLIHLIRDFNSDLIKNPFNEEFKTIAKSFTTLLQKIVVTINRFGLKQYHLNKYKKDTRKFFTTILTATYQSEIAEQYQTRLRKNQEVLFEFLNHNNVSWNNSNAEHAIKVLALHANKNINSFRKSKIDEYLKIMSIYQTCEYRNISFLKFLLSKKTTLNDFEKFRR